MRYFATTVTPNYAPKWTTGGAFVFTHRRSASVHQAQRQADLELIAGWKSEMKGTQRQPGSIDDYISGSPEAVRGELERVRAVIRKAAPGATEAIKYGIPTFVLGENLVHFAAFKKHIGFYPTPSAITAFRDKLSVYKSAKGSVQFPLESPMPLKLIEQIVRFRVKEVLGKSRSQP
jgi:uncharacterized protein YdhG (YjbR/CyaY superfamily)